MAEIHYDLENYNEYLHDESRLPGQGESISFPRTAGEVTEILKEVTARGVSVTIQGARTGISGGAVPLGGHILNLSRMRRITGMRRDESRGEYYLTLEPGVELSSLRETLQAKNFESGDWDAASREALEAFQADRAFFFSPDPTEPSASLGGMAAANASGARSYFYGPTREHITALKVLLPAGQLVVLKRGKHSARGRQFCLAGEEGAPVEGLLPKIHMPEVKNAAGYFVQENMDLLDLFIGSEGTLGIILELEIRLQPLPAQIWGITAFFSDESESLAFVRKLREAASENREVHLVAMEFFNTHALKMLQEEKTTNPAFGSLPAIPAGKCTAVYVEYHAPESEAMETAVGQMVEILGECGGDDEDTWVATDSAEMQPLTFFRHAAAELVNLKVDRIRKKYPGITKLGTDMAVPSSFLEQVLKMYNRDLVQAGLDSVIFGHIGDNHLHVNIIPASPADYAAGKRLYEAWARAVVSWGGSVSAEHGIGKIKATLLALMYGSAGCSEMARLKALLDPGNFLGRGNGIAGGH